MLICHLQLSNNVRMPFLDIQIIHEYRKFTTSVYRKSTFSTVYTRFESLLSSASKFSTACILAHRCFWVCLGRTKLQTECLNYKLIRKVKIGKGTGIPLLTKNEVKPKSGSVILPPFIILC